MKQILTTALLVVVANFAAIPTVSANVGISVVFSEKEISIIGTWYQDHKQSHGKRKTKSKGLPPGKLLVKYPLRVALNFFVADIGNLLPAVISGAEIVAVVMSLPTTGPILLSSLQSQDMYLAGSFLMFLALLTVFGVLVSDIALALLDPRIRLGGTATK